MEVRKSRGPGPPGAARKLFAEGPPCRWPPQHVAQTASPLDLSADGDFPAFLELQEFEIELEGSQTLRILCYEKCYNKTKITKEDGESTDRIMGKGQVQVRPPPSSAHVCLLSVSQARPAPEGISVKLVFPAEPQFLQANGEAVPGAEVGRQEASSCGKSTKMPVHPARRPCLTSRPRFQGLRCGRKAGVEAPWLAKNKCPYMIGGRSPVLRENYPALRPPEVYPGPGDPLPALPLLGRQALRHCCVSCGLACPVLLPVGVGLGLFFLTGQLTRRSKQVPLSLPWRWALVFPTPPPPPPYPQTLG